MSRRLRLATQELGPVEVFVIYCRDGKWEPEWEPIQGDPITKLFTYVSQETYDHALHGWSKPLVQGLGLSPDNVLRKLPVRARECAERSRCPMFDEKACSPQAKNMSWCFDPNVSDDATKRSLSSQIISLWREKVYVLVVE